MNKKRLITDHLIWKRQKLADFKAVDLEIVGTVWGEIIRFIAPEVLVLLVATCRFFRDLLNKQPLQFWEKQVILHVRLFHPRNRRPFIKYSKAILASVALESCIRCHKKTEWRWCLLQEIRLCPHCETPYPCISKTHAISEYHLSAKLLADIPDISRTRRSYYLLEDVKAKAISTFGSQAECDRKDKESQLRKDKIAARKRQGRKEYLQSQIDFFVKQLGKKFEYPSFIHHWCADYIFDGRENPSLKSVINSELRERLVVNSKKLDSVMKRIEKEYITLNYFQPLSAYKKDRIMPAAKLEILYEWKNNHPMRKEIFDSVWLHDM